MHTTGVGIVAITDKEYPARVIGGLNRELLETFQKEFECVHATHNHAKRANCIDH